LDSKCNKECICQKTGTKKNCN